MYTVFTWKIIIRNGRFLDSAPSHIRNPMRSLKFYKDLFSQRLQRAEKNDDVPERLKILIDDVSLNMFTNICRGLFEKDKMIYAFMIAVGILRQAGKVSDQEWRTLLVGAVVMEASGSDDTGEHKRGEGQRLLLSMRNVEIGGTRGGEHPRVAALAGRDRILRVR